MTAVRQKLRPEVGSLLSRWFERGQWLGNPPARGHSVEAITPLRKDDETGRAPRGSIAIVVLAQRLDVAPSQPDHL